MHSPCAPDLAWVPFVPGLLDYNLFLQFTDAPDAAANVWGSGTFEPTAANEQAACPQYDLEDWTGVDSLISPFVRQLDSTWAPCPHATLTRLQPH
jgi:hypothetical protein